MVVILSEFELLLYCLNLLGLDLCVMNFGGGNILVKVRMKDYLMGEDVDVLWVKGLGGDFGSIKFDGFFMFYMSKL